MEANVSPREKAQSGLVILKEAIFELLAAHPEGLRNVDVADSLGLKSDFEGEQRGYLSWSILGLLVNEGRIRYEKVAIADLAATSTCPAKRRAVEKIAEYQVKGATGALRELDGQPQFKCLQGTLKVALARLESTQ